MQMRKNTVNLQVKNVQAYHPNLLTKICTIMMKGKLKEGDKEQVKVIFRKFPEGDVIALFPEDDQGRGLIGSYMTIGQHGDASKSLITDLEPASKEEYSKTSR